MNPKLLLRFIFVALIIQGTLSQTPDLTLFTCEPFDGYPIECVSVLGVTGTNASIYVSNVQGLTQEYFASLFYSNGAPFDLLPALSYDCAQLYVRLWCPTFLQPCTEIGPPINLAAPQPPCQDVCQEFNYQCAKGGIPAMDCNLLNPLSGGPLWPNYTYTVIESLPSCSFMPVEDLGPLDVICPENSVFYPDGDPKVPEPRPICALPCGDFFTIFTGYKTDNLQNGFIEISVLACISLLCSVIMIITFLIFPPLREWPRRIVLFMAIGIFFENLGWVGNSTYRSMTNLACDTHVAINYFGGWCTFQAWSVLFGALVVLCWWCTQAFILFWNVGLMRDPKQLAKLEPLFHLFNWTWPLICSLVFLGRRELGALPGYNYCWIAPDSPLALQWIFFYTILFVGLFIVSICLSITMFRLCRESTLKSTFWERWKYQLQLGTFAFYFLLAVTYVLAFRLESIEANQSRLEAAVGDIYQCVLVEEGGDSCSSYTLNLYLFFSQGILFGIQGIMLLIIFLVLNEYNRNLFILACRNLKEGRSIFYLPQGGSTSTSGSGNSTASSSDDAARQRRSNRKLRRKMVAEAPTV